MAPPAVMASLGRNPFKIQDTFTWEDLSCGSGRSAKQARHNWETDGIHKNGEAHFFELRMDASEHHEGFSLTLSALLYPYGYLVFSEATELRAAETGDLIPLVVAYLRGLFGTPLAERVICRYGGKMLEWLESVEILYEEEPEECLNVVRPGRSEQLERMRAARRIP